MLFFICFVLIVLIYLVLGCDCYVLLLVWLMLVLFNYFVGLFVLLFRVCYCLLVLLCDFDYFHEILLDGCFEICYCYCFLLVCLFVVYVCICVDC